MRRERKDRPVRQLARRILVVTEGLRTEPQYVEGLNDYLRSRGTTTTVKSVPVGKDPLKVVQKCVEFRDTAARRGKEFDECVCLVDVDQHQTLASAIRCAEREKISLLISNLKFEVWLRWHVEDRRAALTSSQLDDRVERLGLVQDKVLSPNFPFDAVDHACQIARAVDGDMCAGRQGPDPSSSLPILVDLMRGA
ncbi:MAG: RloB family protein [Buchananella hordeovulneris]|nr:RloB family protein [Buchananella hordeovulneris]